MAAFMDFALYDDRFGYYARAAQRSGRAGDFFTSVDVGPLFGELLARQIVEMFHLLHPAPGTPHPAPGTPHPAPGTGTQHPAPSTQHPFALVEAGAGNGRLAADILRAVRREDMPVYRRLDLHLVEASRRARDAQSDTLGELRDRLRTSGASLPASFEGVLLANELLDAMPVHQVVMREDGLREVYVGASIAGGAPSPSPPVLTTSEGPPSTPALQAYLDRAGIRLEPGWRAEINLRAIDWIREAARRLTRGFMIVIDYGHDARELYSASHASGTLTSFSGHRSAGPESSAPLWARNPGEQDITAHVDFTSVRQAAEAEGMTTIGFLDQTYFVVGLTAGWTGDVLARHAASLKTLMMPGGLGSTMKVLILGRNVGAPALGGCSFRVRVT